MRYIQCELLKKKKEGEIDKTRRWLKENVKSLALKKEGKQE